VRTESYQGATSRLQHCTLYTIFQLMVSPALSGTTCWSASGRASGSVHCSRFSVILPVLRGRL
jgi:hypothetical protein